MFGNIFGDMFEAYDVLFEVYIEDKLVNRQQMQATKQMLMVSFIQNAQQLNKDARPMKLKMIRQITFWDDFEQKQKTLDNEMEISNNAMVAWQNNRKE